jgi:hypothetical protein
MKKSFKDKVVVIDKLVRNLPPETALWTLIAALGLCLRRTPEAYRLIEAPVSELKKAFGLARLLEPMLGDDPPRIKAHGLLVLAARHLVPLIADDEQHVLQQAFVVLMEIVRDELERMYPIVKAELERMHPTIFTPDDE